MPKSKCLQVEGINSDRFFLLLTGQTKKLRPISSVQGMQYRVMLHARLPGDVPSACLSTREISLWVALCRGNACLIGCVKP